MYVHYVWLMDRIMVEKPKDNLKLSCCECQLEQNFERENNTITNLISTL